MSYVNKIIKDDQIERFVNKESGEELFPMDPSEAYDIQNIELVAASKFLTNEIFQQL